MQLEGVFNILIPVVFLAVFSSGEPCIGHDPRSYNPSKSGNSRVLVSNKAKCSKISYPQMPKRKCFHSVFTAATTLILPQRAPLPV